MEHDYLFKNYPTKRIKPMDGMPITADAWEEAHFYHELTERFHGLLRNGTGILTGLEVVASDPPDTTVYVQPGLAVDPEGHHIAVPMPLTYNVGENNDGLLYILLTFRESKPRRDRENEFLYYIHSEFSVVATPTLPAEPYVELGRVVRSARKAAIKMPAQPDHPGMDELDLRFRRMIGFKQPDEFRMAVCPLGKVGEAGYAQGLSSLAQALRNTTRDDVWVDLDVALTDEALKLYALVYVVNEDGKEATQDVVTALAGFLKHGGTVVMESVRPGKKGAAKGDDALKALATALGRELKPVERGHALLTTPNLFAAPPAGFEADGELSEADGVVMSTMGYGRLWNGDDRSGAASRESIRAAVEWGANLVRYAQDRRKSG